jgi:hypothetical protein
MSGFESLIVGFWFLPVFLNIALPLLFLIVWLSRKLFFSVTKILVPSKKQGHQQLFAKPLVHQS